MIEDERLTLKYDGARLVVASRSNIAAIDRGLLILIFGAAFLMVPAIPIGLSRTGWPDWSGLLGLAACLACALGAMLLVAYQLSPRSLVTVFDLDAATIAREFRAFKDRYVRRKTISFADIKGIGVRSIEPDDCHDWVFDIVITLADGKIVSLMIIEALNQPGRAIIEDAAKKICEKTGLPRLDSGCVATLPEIAGLKAC